MASVEARLASKSVRSGDHVLWCGAVDARGVGLIKMDRRTTTVRRVAWELVNGPLPSGTRVLVQCDEAGCIAAEHLILAGGEEADVAPVPPPRARPRRQRGSGSMRERSPGVWELAVVHGVHADGRPRRALRTFRGPAVEANKALAAFVVELDKEGMPERSARRGGLTVDDLVQEYWVYAESQGRAHSTLVAYRDVYKHWVQPPLGHLRADRVSQRDLDRAFGAMRTAGQSHSRMNQAKVVLSNAYKLGKRYHLVTGQSPVAGYELPRSTKGRREIVVPEVTEVLALLETAERICPELAPVLKLAATTGCRRGELCGLRRSRVNVDAGEITIDRTVNDAGGTIVVVDLTKTGKARTLAIDVVTVQMLTQLFERQDADAASVGLTIQPDGYVFGLLGSHQQPMRPEYMTRKMREVRAALTLPASSFDATILALRKFTTTELLDAGFNPSMVSSRQGHTTQTMLAHYGKRRRSADRAAAEHLGARVLGARSTAGSS